MIRFKFLFIAIILLAAAKAQENDAKLSIKLATFSASTHANVRIEITNNSTSQKFTTTSNGVGIAHIDLPSNASYTAQPSNYSGSHIFTIPKGPIVYSVTISYDADDLTKAKRFEPTEAEKNEQIAYVKSLPSSINYTVNPIKIDPKDKKNTLVTIQINDLYSKPLANEKFILVGKTYGKKYIAQTNAMGECILPVAKGDIYNLHFKYDSNYTQLQVKISTGWSKQSLQFEYIGAVEIEKRKKEKEIAIKKRMLEEEEERKRYKEWLALHKKHLLEQTKKELEEAKKQANYYNESIINKVFQRNHWQDKLIVCDLTGSMQPYKQQLLAWYILNHLKEQNMQFVFFNDGDSKNDGEKIIGSTGGIYYFESKGIDSLIQATNKVSGAGDGGDCPENNIEALLFAIKVAKPQYKEIVMIADSKAPIKDIELVVKLNKPVHVILCGAESSVEEDYLRLAYATKGTVHTIEKDIIDLAKLSNGQTITINRLEYKMLNGKFFALNKV